MRYVLLIVGLALASTFCSFAETVVPGDHESAVEGFPMDPPGLAVNPQFGMDQEMIPEHGLPEGDSASPSPLMEVHLNDRPGYYAGFDPHLHKVMMQMASTAGGSNSKGGGSKGDREKRKGGVDGDTTIDAASPDGIRENYFYQLHALHSDFIN